MTMNKGAKIMRVVAIVFLALSSAVTILSGVGTTCVAFGAEKYDSMTGIVPFKGLYQAFVFLTLLVGLAMLYATFAFARGKKWAYLGSIIILAISAVIGWVHYSYSLKLRGSGAPANMRVYVAVLTIIILLILRIPSIWRGLSFGGGDEKSGGSAGVGAALIVLGLGAIVSPLIFTNTHILGGINWAHAFDLPMMLVGGLLVLGGGALILSHERARVAIADESLIA